MMLIDQVVLVPSLAGVGKDGLYDKLCLVRGELRKRSDTPRIGMKLNFI